MRNNLREAATKSLKQAVADALEKKRRLGQYAIIVKDGVITRMIPDENAPDGWRYVPESTFGGANE